MSKVAPVTLLFWLMKIVATVLGETGGDMISMTLNAGYGATFLMVGALFLVALGFQLTSKAYHPALYWTVILTTLIAGTALSDYMDRTMGLGYTLGAALLAATLAILLVAWYLTEHSLSVSRIQTRRAETFYWMAILVSNTLGTALGDFLADDTGLGYVGGAVLIGGLLLLTAILYYFTRTSRVALFWAAFILSRPFGATFGDFLTKPLEKGGLDLGTIGSSIVLVVMFGGMLAYSIWKHESGSSVSGPMKAESDF